MGLLPALWPAGQFSQSKTYFRADATATDFS